jgi:hypothetical protein
MYTAVSTVKMYAWRNATKISKAVKKMSRPNGKMPIGMRKKRMVSAWINDCESSAKITSNK